MTADPIWLGPPAQPLTTAPAATTTARRRPTLSTDVPSHARPGPEVAGGGRRQRHSRGDIRAADAEHARTGSCRLAHAEASVVHPTRPVTRSRYVRYSIRCRRST